MSKFTAIFDRVLIDPEPRKEKTDGGIDIPVTAEFIPLYGTVVSKGDKCEYVNEGDRVIFEAMAFSDMPYEGKDMKIGIERNIVAII